MSPAQHIVVSFSEARKARGLPAPKTPPSEPTPAEKEISATGPEATGATLERANQVVEAMAAWGEHDEMSAADVQPLLSGLIRDIMNDHGMQQVTGVDQLDRALEGRFGHASLGRVALMTPQEILSLEGVCTTTLDQAIAELAKRSALSIPELICGRGKAGIQEGGHLHDSFFEIAVGMPGYQILT
jgi:hypothetical protein